MHQLNSRTPADLPIPGTKAQAKGGESTPKAGDLFSDVDAYLLSLPDVALALPAMRDERDRRAYLTAVVGRLAKEQPATLAKLLAKHYHSRRQSDLAVMMRRGNRTRRHELVTVNGRRGELSCAAANVLRACDGQRSVFADDRRVAELVREFPELDDELAKDTTRSRSGHSYHWLVSDRLAGAIAFVQ